MKLKPHERVDLETAKARAVSALHNNPGLNGASRIADFIWPDHSMKAQGAGAAASRILKHLAREGKARWHSTGTNWGWTSCRPGR